MKIDSRKLDVIMAEQCLTSESLATRTGVAQVTIARIRRGAQQPRPLTVGKIAKALNVSVQDIIEMGAATPETK